MKTFVNYPTSGNSKKELEKKISLFHSSLIIETIKQLNYTNEIKNKILNLILNEIKKVKDSS